MDLTSMSAQKVKSEESTTTTTTTTESPSIQISPGTESRLAALEEKSRAQKRASSELGEEEAVKLDLFRLIQRQEWRHTMNKISASPETAKMKQTFNLEGRDSKAHPLHLAVSKKPPVHVVEALLKACPEAAKHADSRWGRLPLHVACIFSSSAQVLKVLTEAYDEALRSPDRADGRLPVHYACLHGSPFEISVLVEAEQRALVYKDLKGKTPLDLAKESSNPHREAILQRLETKVKVVMDSMRQQARRRRSLGESSISSLSSKSTREKGGKRRSKEDEGPRTSSNVGASSKPKSSRARAKSTESRLPANLASRPSDSEISTLLTASALREHDSVTMMGPRNTSLSDRTMRVDIFPQSTATIEKLTRTVHSARFTSTTTDSSSKKSSRSGLDTIEDLESVGVKDEDGTAAKGNQRLKRDDNRETNPTSDPKIRKKRFGHLGSLDSFSKSVTELADAVKKESHAITSPPAKKALVEQEGQTTTSTPGKDKRQNQTETTPPTNDKESRTKVTTTSSPDKDKKESRTEATPTSEKESRTKVTTMTTPDKKQNSNEGPTEVAANEKERQTKKKRDAPSETADDQESQTKMTSPSKKKDDRDTSNKSSDAAGGSGGADTKEKPKEKARSGSKPATPKSDGSVSRSLAKKKSSKRSEGRRMKSSKQLFQGMPQPYMSAASKSKGSRRSKTTDDLLTKQPLPKPPKHSVNGLALFFAARAGNETSGQQADDSTVEDSVGAMSLPLTKREADHLASSYKFHDDSVQQLLELDDENSVATTHDDDDDGDHDDLPLSSDEHSEVSKGTEAELFKLEAQIRNLDVRKKALSQECSFIHVAIEKKLMGVAKSKEVIQKYQKQLEEIQSKLAAERASLELTETSIQVQRETLSEHEEKIRLVEKDRAELLSSKEKFFTERDLLVQKQMSREGGGVVLHESPTATFSP